MTDGDGCIYCGGECVEGRVQCERHLEIQRRSARKCRAFRRARGQCAQCRRRAEPGHVRCEAHLKSSNDAVRKWKARHRAAA